MSIRMFSRCSVWLALVAMISGCSVIDLGGPDWSDHSNECQWNRSSCMYEGRYEPGEEAYAEQEAKRLNREASLRLRRNSIK